MFSGTAESLLLRSKVKKAEVELPSAQCPQTSILSVNCSCREWGEDLKLEAELKLSRQPDAEMFTPSSTTQPETYSVRLKPGPIEIHPVQYSALRR